MSTIANQIQRIKAAKSVLAKLAVRLGFYPTETAAEAELIGGIAESLDTITLQAPTNVEIEEGNTKTFSAGYYPSAFVVTATSGEISEDETPGTATAGDILLGETAWVNGVQITGTMPDKGNVTVTLTTDASFYTVPTGYHAGGGQIGVASAAGTYTITTADLANTEIVIAPAAAGAPSPNYYLTGVTVDTSAIVDALAAI